MKADIAGLHLLVAEDNELNMEIAEFLLENAGATITKAMNGEEALRLFREAKEGTYDAILMDVMMASRPRAPFALFRERMRRSSPSLR